MPRESISITIPGELIDEIDEMAENAELNRSQQVEQLLRRALDGGEGIEGFGQSAHFQGSGAMIFDLLPSIPTLAQWNKDRDWIVKLYAEKDPNSDIAGGGMTVVEDRADLKGAMDRAGMAVVRQRGKGKQKRVDR